MLDSNRFFHPKYTEVPDSTTYGSQFSYAQAAEAC